MTTTRRTVRVSDPLWKSFGEWCRHYGKTRSGALVEFMQAKTHDNEQRKARELDNEGSKDT